MPCRDYEYDQRSVPSANAELALENSELRLKTNKLSAYLCEAMAAFGKPMIPRLSPELQLWWKDHQEADALRLKTERIERLERVANEIGGLSEETKDFIINSSESELTTVLRNQNKTDGKEA